jgi:uncharacterized protein YjbI with pentapeptide repeats
VYNDEYINTKIIEFIEFNKDNLVNAELANANLSGANIEDANTENADLPDGK